MPDTPDRTKIFISYSHQDADWLKRLRIHLKPLEREYDIALWDDTRIVPGSKWKEEIEKAIRTARVAILLVSADFLASDFITKDELPPLLSAAQNEGAIILPVILSPCRFLKTISLSQFQAVNNPLKPIINLSPGKQEAMFARVAEQIENSLNSLEEMKRRESLPVSVPDRLRSDQSKQPDEKEENPNDLRGNDLAAQELHLSPALIEEIASRVIDRIGNPTLESTEISQEAIDEIVRRVVSQISDRVVREIAWEIIPDYIERTVKDLAYKSFNYPINLTDDDISPRQEPVTQPIAEPKTKPISNTLQEASETRIDMDENAKQHADARRFARLLISEIKLYEEEKVNIGLASNDVYNILKEEIDRSRAMYEKRITPHVAERFDYFNDELVNDIAKGDPSKLGPDYPYYRHKSNQREHPVLLVADDSITIQKVVTLTFRDEGFEIICVSDGDAAIKKLEEIHPDMVLADIFMPGKNGYEVCGYIKNNPKFRHIPVVLLVGASEPFDKSEASKVHADEHLSKPFESQKLINTVTRLLK
jgi:CheY-like chemotaxis protein